MLHVGLYRAADELARAEDHPAKRAPLTVDMLGRGIDHDIGALRDGARKDRRGKDVVDDHRGARRMGEIRHRGDIHHVERRVRDRLEEHGLRVGADRRAPLVKVRAIDEGHLDAEPRQHLFEHVKA